MALTVVPIAALLAGTVLTGAMAGPGDVGTQAIRDTFRNSSKINIPTVGEARLYPSTITVTGLPAETLDVNIRLFGFQHTNPTDVDIMVVGPTGARAIILSDVGGGSDLVSPGINLTLDDEASSSLSTSAKLTAGSFKPTNEGAGDTFPKTTTTARTVLPLGIFDGTDPNGVWKLYVVDDRADFKGTIERGWEVEVLFGEPPIARDDTYQATRNTTLRVSEANGVLANDDDGDAEKVQQLTAKLKSPPRKGTVRLLSDGSFTYRPATDERGVDSFTYTVTDDDGLKDIGRVEITIAS